MRRFTYTIILVSIYATIFSPCSAKAGGWSGSVKVRSGGVPTGDDDENRGVLKGSVTTGDEQPASFATIRIATLNKTTMTDEEGYFRMHLPPGTYTLEISLTGHKTINQSATIERGKVTTLAIRLSPSGQNLQEVVVNGGRTPYSRSSSDYVAKMPLNRMENPQVYTVITKDMLADQMVFSADDAMRNATGIQKMWDATGRSGDGGGYYNSRGFILQSQLRNGIAGNVSAVIDASNLDRIEVIKGPSATLFGSTLTSYGGLVNRITKKPYAGYGGELSYAGGNYGFNRLSADINTPLDKAGTTLLRLNAAWLDEGSFQDNGFNRNLAIAPSLSYRYNDRLSFLFDAEIYRGRNLGTPIFFFPSGQTISSMGVSRADQLPIDYKRSFYQDDLSQRSANSNFFGQMLYKLSDRWNAQTNVTLTNSYSDGPSPYFYLLADSFVTHNRADIGTNYISRNDQFTANSRDRMIEVQQNLNGEFHIGGMKNRIAAGLDYFYHNSNQLFSGGTYDTILSHGSIPTYRNFNRTNLQNLYATKGVAFYYPVRYISNTYSAYASDVLNLTDGLMVMAALRVDRFVNQGNYDVTTGKTNGAYNQTALSPKFGIVYQPVARKVSLFANYQNGFKNQTGTDYKGRVFKPEIANQAEAGVKLDLLGGKLTGTVSVYSIKVQHIVRSYILADSGLPVNPQIQDGTQLSRGMEAEVVANPLPGLNLLAGFSYNDSKYEKANADVQGRRPGTAGSPYMANWWVSYRLQERALHGLGLGFGGNYASDNKIINSVSQGVFTLPAYTVLNASVFYEFAKMRIAVKSDNLGNQKYWLGYTTVNPQKLRSVVASITWKF